MSDFFSILEFLPTWSPAGSKPAWRMEVSCVAQDTMPSWTANLIYISLQLKLNKAEQYLLHNHQFQIPHTRVKNSSNDGNFHSQFYQNVNFRSITHEQHIWDNSVYICRHNRYYESEIYLLVFYNVYDVIIRIGQTIYFYEISLIFGLYFNRLI